jgi:hypothetical protein
MKRLLLLLAAAVCLLSCRRLVLEDRADCPSFLFFDVTNAGLFNPYDRVYATASRHPAGELIAGATATLSDITGRVFFFEVRHAEAVRGYGVLGAERCIMQNGSEWIVPVGNQYDTLFRFSYVAAVEPDSFTVPVELVKEYAKVTVQFVGVETFSAAGGRFPFDVTVVSGTCGVDALTGVPVRGPFEYRPVETSIGRFEFLLPRQADRNLCLELYGREGLSDRTGHLNTFDLFSILEEDGAMDWQARNLSDVYIEIDYQEALVNVSVSPWVTEDLDYEF